MLKVTPEDLINLVIEADDLRRRARGQSSTRAAAALGLKRPPFERVFIEPFFNALGALWGQLMLALPVSFWRPFIQWLNQKMGNYRPLQNAQLPGCIEETVRLARDLKQTTGQWPALLILTSHPDTEGPLHWLRFELLRQGLRIADAAVEAEHPGFMYPPHPKCFLAIDPFALDTVSVPAGAFYAAWVNRIYLAWDRQPTTQSWIQEHVLLRGTSFDQTAWRLLRTLKADVPVLMVLSGGLPYNARLLYAAREFVQRLPVGKWSVPKRQAQLELLTILKTPEGSVWPADDGDIPPGKQRLIAQALVRWGLPESQVGSCLNSLVEEFKLTVPRRERLFRVLRGRLVQKGKPLIVVRIDHSDAPPYVRISEPVIER